MEQIPLINSLFRSGQLSQTNSTTSLDPQDILPSRQEGTSSPSAIKTLNALTGFSFQRETINLSSFEEVFTNPKKMPLDNAISLFLAAPLLGFFNNESSPFKEG